MKSPGTFRVTYKRTDECSKHVKHAGSIFLGPYAPEPLGDYLAGPNHVLPTSGTARFFSPLSVDDFVKNQVFYLIRRKH